jgi:hypothetical protein
MSVDLRVEKIVDFTDILKMNPNYTIFNPCITHYKDDLYFCCVRVISKNLKVKQKTGVFSDLFEQNIYADPNHPWRTRWNSLNSDDATYIEQPQDGIQFTQFFMLRILKDHTAQLVKKYDQLFNDITTRLIDNADVNSFALNMNVLLSKQFSNLSNKYETMIDTRIHKTPAENIFFITGNISHRRSIGEPRSVRKNQHTLQEPTPLTQGEGGFIIGIKALYIDPETLKITELTPNATILCPEYSAKTEKNWTLSTGVKEDGMWDIKIMYQIADATYGHEILQALYNPITNQFSVNCVNITHDYNPGIEHQTVKEEINTDDNITFYERLENTYKINDTPVLYISPTTPMIPFQIGQDLDLVLGDDSLLGVGHVKYSYHDMENILFNNTPIKEFTKLCKDKIINMHYHYIYLFFFYACSRDPEQNFRLTHTSKFFLPQPANVSLIFPMGITKNPEKDIYYLSYGDYDTRCSYMTFNGSAIRASLSPMPDIRGLTENDILKVFSNGLFRFTKWEDDKIKKVIL